MIDAAAPLEQARPRRVQTAFVLLRSFFAVVACMLVLLAGLVASEAAGSAPATAILSANGPTDLSSSFMCSRQQMADLADPEKDAPSEARSACPVLVTGAGFRTLGRLRLAAPPGSDQFVLQIPSARVDQVQLFSRSPGGAWSTSRAGDRVPLSAWPIFGQVPTFPLAVTPLGLDVVVGVEDIAAAQVKVFAWPRTLHDEVKVRQANLSGIVIGLGLMALITCIISASTQRSRTAWVGVAYATLALYAVLALNGYGAIWLYPEVPFLNDYSKIAAPILLTALLFWWLLRQLDRLPPGRWRDVAVWLVLGVGGLLVVLGAQDAMMSWRRAMLASFVIGSVTALIGLCTVSWLRGGRHISWLAAALAMYVACVAVSFSDVSLWRGVDVKSAIAGCLLFASVLVLRHAQFMRMRYGRDILGVEARRATRDPLTALLSYRGLHQACQRLQLKQRSQQDQELCALLLMLCKADRTGEALGFELTDEILVQLAFAMQNALGDEWSIARLSRGHFAAVCLQARDRREEVTTAASRLLAACSRLTMPLDVVNELDLRITYRCGLPLEEDLSTVLRVMDDCGRTLAGPKRIGEVP